MLQAHKTTHAYCNRTKVPTLTTISVQTGVQLIDHTCEYGAVSYRPHFRVSLGSVALAARTGRILSWSEIVLRSRLSYAMDFSVTRAEE
jgi:hypothetical protein